MNSGNYPKNLTWKQSREYSVKRGDCRLNVNESISAGRNNYDCKGQRGKILLVFKASLHGDKNVKSLGCCPKQGTVPHSGPTLFYNSADNELRRDHASKPPVYLLIQQNLHSVSLVPGAFRELRLEAANPERLPPGLLRPKEKP